MAKEVAKELNLTNELTASLVATTMLEQPQKFPNHNCLGIGVWGKVFPWGWNSVYWDKVRPIGYIIIGEGYGKKRAVLFAFKQLKDCLVFAGGIWNKKKKLRYFYL